MAADYELIYSARVRKLGATSAFAIIFSVSRFVRLILMYDLDMSSDTSVREYTKFHK